MEDIFLLEKKFDPSITYIDNKYELISQISCTINSKIYKAYDLFNKKNVVIKIIRLDTDDLSYQKEIKILAHINSFFIPKFIDYCFYGKKAICIIMEFFDSITLKEKIKINSLWSLSEPLLIFENILKAVVDIHKHNIIHNDLKPENIIYFRTGDIKIIDFGISVFSDEPTQLSKVKGTPKYIAPEILNIKKCDKRSDIYSLGIILYELLTGISPFENHNKISTIKKQKINKYVPPIHFNNQISKELENIILKALQTNPKDRFQTVTEFLEVFQKNNKYYTNNI